MNDKFCTVRGHCAHPRHYSISQLPFGVQFNIFSYLGIPDILSARECCKYWKALADSDYVWKILVRIHFDVKTEAGVPIKTSWRQYFWSRIKCFDRMRQTKGMVISENGRTVHSTGTVKKWATASIGYPYLKTGVHYCEFMIDKCLKGYLQRTWKMIIGIVSKSFVYMSGKYVGCDDHSFGYIAQTGEKIGGGQSPKEYALAYGENDRIGVLVNMIKEEISFYRNGVNMGVAFTQFGSGTHISQYHFAISFIKSNMYATVLPLAKCPADTDVSKAATISPKKTIIPSNFSLKSCPDDIKLSILGIMNSDGWNLMRKINHNWKQLAESDYLWRERVQMQFSDVGNLLDTRDSAPWRSLFYRHCRRFSVTHCTPGLAVSNDCLTLTSTDRISYWAAARVEYPRMTSGSHYLEFRIDKYRHGSIGNTWKVVCGIVSDSFDYQLTKWVGVDEKSFGYIAQNGNRVGPSCKNQGLEYAEPYEEDDCIGILVDLERDELFFYKNGVNMGMAFQNFRHREKNFAYYFAVSIARWGMEVSVIPDARCPDRDIDIV
ncbi:uncharacterized protein LOC126304706 [Schistocerca gregaria]|uniref:uncharacterized protein LOC126304706 n=1 Tax=Schistocerca gregaria TaxID=7010 RepID=UPI00211ED333|nr:uncharacterized protein LOC126304706 [Schistocerca gregaria]XP_049847836.1 uncharacterized protein LOC126304706 [Schistocerca gregaria]